MLQLAIIEIPHEEFNSLDAVKVLSELQYHYEYLNKNASLN